MVQHIFISWSITAYIKFYSEKESHHAVRRSWINGCVVCVLLANLTRLFCWRRRVYVRDLRVCVVIFGAHASMSSQPGGIRHSLFMPDMYCVVHTRRAFKHIHDTDVVVYIIYSMYSYILIQNDSCLFFPINNLPTKTLWKSTRNYRIMHIWRDVQLIHKQGLYTQIVVWGKFSVCYHNNSK